MGELAHEREVVMGDDGTLEPIECGDVLRQMAREEDLPVRILASLVMWLMERRADDGEVIMDLRARVVELEAGMEREVEISFGLEGRIDELERWRVKALRDWARMMPPHGDEATNGE